MPVSGSPTEHFEHAEHAEHAAHSRDRFLAVVSVTIAVLAVAAATVGSFETLESGQAISDKNESVLLQNKAADSWAFFQANSLKKNMYDIAAATDPVHAGDYAVKARDYEHQQANEKAQPEGLGPHPRAEPTAERHARKGRQDRQQRSCRGS